MKNLLKIVISISLLGNIACNSVNDNVSPNSNEEILKLMNSLGSLNDSERNQATTQLLEITRKSNDYKTQITNKIINETSKICSEEDVMYSNNDFYKLQSMSNILADLNNIESLNILIDCSNHKLPFGGLSNSNYATKNAIIKFNSKAIPSLKKKLGSSGKEIKCNISELLSGIGGAEAEKILREALKIEKDELIINCLNRSLKSFESK